ncbi:MAG: phenylacetate--CoA ligase [Cytophagaceae bacterium]|nr:phenylacetate--CoA ligase [Cytophagaceae bacterium]|tara:strand:+ start:52 stop:1338 length:1287 start_codon:yes stop_codon:yes gene_type:complete
MIPEIELQSPQEIKEYQEKRLRELLPYLQEDSAFYKRHFEQNKIDISQIQTLEDLQQIPTVSKDDLQKNNEDFLCVPRSKVIDHVTTSGTLGDPVSFYLTDKDLNRLAYNEAISFACSGVTADDTIQLMTTMDRRFMAGMAYFLGARQLGAGIIRTGSGIPELQWDSIEKFNPTYLIAVPSFLVKLIAFAEKNGHDLNATSVKAAICIGEPIREPDFQLNTLGKKIKEHWDIDLYSTYASTEMATAFNECSAQQGGHLHPELIIAEILDENEQPVNAGEVGELVVTTLGVEGMPLLRFKTGDMVQAHDESCTCGRNSLRLGPVVGRKKQMIKYKGTTLYPPAMINLLNDFSGIDGYVIELRHNELGTDEILLRIHAPAANDILLKEVKDHFRAKLRVRPNVVFESKETLDAIRFPKTSRKPVVVVDLR